jgi:hypothetical protein
MILPSVERRAQGRAEGHNCLFSGSASRGDDPSPLFNAFVIFTFLFLTKSNSE